MWRLQGSAPAYERSARSRLEERLRDLAAVDEAIGRMPPFAGRSVAVVFPRVGSAVGLDARSRAGLEDMCALFEQNRPMLEAELGGELRFVADDPGEGPRWLIGPAGCNASLQRLGPACATRPGLSFDRERELLIADSPSVPEIFEAFSYLRTLARGEGDELGPAACETREAAVARIALEVADTWPSFERRRLDWLEISIRHADAVLAAREPLAAIQIWLAELGDAHTWLRARTAQAGVSFDAIALGGSLILTRVPKGSPAWCAGARSGDRLIGQPVEEWWKRTAATPHQRSRLAALRMLQGPQGSARAFVVEGADGRRVGWSETLGAGVPARWIESSALPSGAGYLRIRAWLRTPENEAAIDEALERFAGSPGLVVDLRGNTGGNGQMACAFRDRFLREPARIGEAQFSGPGGELGPRLSLAAEPAPPALRWKGPVRFLTDPLLGSRRRAAGSAGTRSRPDLGRAQRWRQRSGPRHSHLR